MKKTILLGEDYRANVIFMEVTQEKGGFFFYDIKDGKGIFLSKEQWKQLMEHVQKEGIGYE
jgi:hypothetical protein